MPDLLDQGAASAGVKRQTVETLAAALWMMWSRKDRPTPETSEIPAWRAAIDLLLRRGEFAVAKFGAEILLAANPADIPSQTLCRMLAVLPPPPSGAPFVDDSLRDVQIVANKNSSTALLVFADTGHAVGMPFMVAHRWLAKLDATIFYLRDFRNLNYASGIRALGSNRQETIEALRAKLEALKIQRLLCYGNSVAGFAACQYGIDLHADAVLSLAGPTDLALLHSAYGQRLNAVSPLKNLRDILAAATPPAVLTICGDGNWDDRLQAENIANLPTVTVRMLERFGAHNVSLELICREQFAGILDWLRTATRTTPRDVAPLPFQPWRAAIAAEITDSRGV